MFFQIAMLVIGTAVLIIGADMFVDGASKLAAAMKVPPLVIGLTLVSMGTSAPEASVSIIGATNGLNGISVGNVVGSNIFNALPILGFSALLVPLSCTPALKKYDIPFMVAVYALLFVFAAVITPMTVNVVEASALLTLFVGYTAFMIVRAVKSDRPPEIKPLPLSDARTPTVFSVLFTVLGLIAVIMGGDLVVDNAAAVAQTLGLSQSLVGLTIVAVGTSLPELVTSTVASIKGENDIAIGNVVGSNIFNTVFILGVSAAIRPPVFGSETLIDLAVMLASGILLLLTVLCARKIGRVHGALAILLYSAYLTYIIIRH